MKLDAYSSLAAFLAHWRALKHANTGALVADEIGRRAEMDAGHDVLETWNVACRHLDHDLVGHHAAAVG